MRTKKLFLNGPCAELAGVVYCVVFTSSSVAAEIPAVANSQTPVAIVNGQSISDAELSTAAAAQLRQILLQEYQVKKDVLENLVNQRVVEAEARRQGLTVEKLLEREVDAKVGKPSEIELKAYYLGQKDRWNLPFAEIQQQLSTGLRQGKIQQARQEYLKHLREAPGVAILLRPPRVNVSADPGRMRGDPQVPVTIVEFSDYQCPYCQAAEPTLKEVLARYEGHVSLAYRDFPLSQIHPHAQLAAEASRCAAEQGRFWEYHDALFANQSMLQQPVLIEHARKLGIDEKSFEACLTTGKFRSAVQSDYQDGIKAGVNGTPSFFINGIYLNGNQPTEEFARIIEDELAAIRLKSFQAAELSLGKEDKESGAVRIRR
jgi:protein-disulfide isomerase